ncbi:MAG: DNA repair protein RecN [Oscillospiraceae bacterium]|nr:DNA repair protein RecN [Oscillospiraceae bacterium]
MLCELCIENLAVIEHAVIPFSNDFNVFTGETGAGKSILINGINAVLGKRVSKDIVRSGCDKASVTALFKGLSAETKEKLDEFGIDHSDDELLITRTVLSDGGSGVRINSRTSSVSVLKEIGITLIDVHGQHDNRILMYPEKHIDIVDNFAGIQSEIDDYRESFHKLQNISRRIKKLSDNESEKLSRLETLRVMTNEIKEAQISDENEDEKIDNEFNVISNSSAISKTLSSAAEDISGDDDNDGLCGVVNDIITALKRYSDIMPSLDEISSRLESLKIEAADIADQIKSLNDNIDVDESRLSYLDNRRDTLISIKKKYGPELKDVIEKYTSAQNEAAELIDNTEEIKRITAERNELLKEVSAKAKSLSQKRRKAADQLSSKIEKELKFLDMPNVKLEISQTLGKLTSSGMDSMEILISVNAGEPPKPIAKIASGGELSRIMLAIKNVTAEKDDVPTMIFDEIDTGVSGKAAQKIGVKLREISRSRQVLCVTHLSQIAVMADSHLFIEKKTKDNRTFTEVSVLDKDSRAGEIARILGGDNITGATLEAAREQLASRDEIYGRMLEK